MYYPYFRGKQFDLLAIKTLLLEQRLSQKIIPIIEPVKQSKALNDVLQLLETQQHPYFLVRNPQAGDFLTAEGMELLKTYPGGRARIIDQPIETVSDQPGLWIVQESKPVLASSWVQNTTPVLTPQEFRLLQKIEGPKIIQTDPFTRLPRNQFYQEYPDERFTREHLDYSKKGFVGFSDFSIDSRIYYEKSYPSKYLAFHGVYFQKQEVFIRHLLSSEEAPTQKEKFMELMTAVTAWQEEVKTKSLGLELLQENFVQRKFPGMGVMRKAAVLHHLELISVYLDRNH